MAYYKETEFRQWLKNDPNRWNDDASVKSYISGVRSLIDWLDDNKSLFETNKHLKAKYFQEYLKLIDKKSDFDTLFSAALNIIQKKIDTNPSDKTTFQNRKSYLVAYADFMRAQPLPQSAGGLSDSHRKMLRKNSNSATYTCDELIEEFVGRVTSQDRISKSKEVLFPISIIRKLWSDETNNWAREVCEKIYLIVSRDGESFKEQQIKNIESLRIELSGDVKITINGVEYTLYTSYSDPYETIKIDQGTITYYRKRTPLPLLSLKIPSNGYIIDKNLNIRDGHNTSNVLLWHVRPMKVKSLGQIVIDHDIPISTILVENKNKLKALKKISDVYRNLSAEYNLSVTAGNVREFGKKLQNDPQGQASFGLNFPSGDMGEIGKCKLVLMGDEENSAKSDS